MSTCFDCGDASQRTIGLRAAATALRGGKLIVLPTDTVYGVGADAFTPSAVDALLAAKGRGRDLPVPVLVGAVRTLDGLADRIPAVGRRLVEAFWPGPLTLVCHAQPALAWDLGETRGTVAVRMPRHPLALGLLAEVGPLAVSSANRSGAPPATTAADARAQLGDGVAVYLDGGPTAGAVPSSIVDVTGERPRLLRSGVLRVEQLREIAPDLEVVT